MLFCHGDSQSVGIVKDAMDDFKRVSGLSINYGKSSMFIAGVGLEEQREISNRLGIQKQSLPVTYLGVPLISSRLNKTNCIPLIERITSRIRLWTSSSLSYAGRLQLIKVVLFSIQAYWSTKFQLPIVIIQEIEKILRNFLWKGTSLTRGDAKVTWSEVC